MAPLYEDTASPASRRLPSAPTALATGPARHPTRAARRIALAVLAVVCLITLGGARPAAELPQDLPARYRQWLRDVEPLILDAERDAFLALERDYQRDAFIRRFWQVRDIFPETGRNEFRDQWEVRLETVKRQYGDLEVDRARATLLAGEPDRVARNPCLSALRPLEIWIYDAARQGPRAFTLVFVRRAGKSDPFRLWSPLEGPASIGVIERSLGVQSWSTLKAACPEGYAVATLLDAAIDLERLADAGIVGPDPGTEWIAAFLERSTDLADDTARLSATLDVQYPGRRRARTAVQALITVPSDEVQTRVFRDLHSYNFLVDGEVLREDSLFEKFRYRFDLPADAEPVEAIPLIIQRYLRPGEYVMIVRVEDLNGDRAQRLQVALDVPQVTVDHRRPIIASPLATTPLGTTLAEANATIGSGDHTLRILPPPETFHTGRLRVDTQVTGEGIDRVAFHLNGRRVMSKRRPPFSVELDLGERPRIHAVQAVAYDAGGNELARDEIPVNIGPHRFAVRLLGPQTGARYVTSLTAHAEVDVPSGQRLDRLEFYLNETLLATLFQRPFIQPILLPQRQRITYVRAVAYLEDGNSTEDLAFINAPETLDEIQVNFVELYTTFLDRHGEAITDLSVDEIVVREDGVEQAIRRLERVQDLPIHTGIVLDTSTSMREKLPEAEKAAMKFFERILRPRDRAAVIVFNDRSDLRVPLTNSLEVLAGGLAGLEAEGETTLYDSLIYSLYYLGGVTGKRALIVITDGDDSRSEHSFQETLEFAQRQGIAIYPIAFNVTSRAMEVRTKVQRLASQTGGSCFFIERASELDRIYERIEGEMRSQFLVGYQSSQGTGDSFRTIAITVQRPGVKAKTIPGYFP